MRGRQDLGARSAGHAPQTCAHVQLAVEGRSRGRKGETPQPRLEDKKARAHNRATVLHPVTLSQTRGRRGAERLRARQSTLRQSPHPASAPVGQHGRLYGCRNSPAAEASVVMSHRQDMPKRSAGPS